MMHAAVNDVDKAKAFYVDLLGFKALGDSGAGEYRWLPIELPGGVTFVVSNVHEYMKPGVLKLYFTSSDVSATHEELRGKGITVNEIKDDLYGPGSGVKWFNFADPDGNQLFCVQG